MRHVICCFTIFFTIVLVQQPVSAEQVIHVQSAMPPPTWALMQRELLEANAVACEEFFAKYFDERGYLLCVERWGGDDGPDDAPENCADWPLLHALGGQDVVRDMYSKAWEGHLRQYTEAKTVEVPFTRDGMYYKEFPVMFDWQHNSEGLRLFHLKGLSDPYNNDFVRRARRFAGFYMDEEPGAPNFDPKYKVIRSMINGSRGPMLRKATALDWTGDRIEVVHRFELGHNERNYTEMLEHFKDYNDVVGDHPLNLLVTNLVHTAYLATGDEKYKKWIMEYVDAWYERMEANGNVIPSNIGLDGTIGGACDGKWYGGTYGWGFTVVVPQTNTLTHRNRVAWSFLGFMHAYALSGRDDRYLEIWRKQTDVINSQRKMVDGQAMYPRMYGDDGWYQFVPQKFKENALEIYYLTMDERDRAAVGDNPWIRYLEGKYPEYPIYAMSQAFGEIRQRVEGMRNDNTTPDTRLADDPMKFNPARVQVLLRLMMGGIDPGRRASTLYSRLRYFDPVARRAGVPEDVAALIDSLSDDQLSVTLVNISQLETKSVVVQTGANGEDQCISVSQNGQETTVDAPSFSVRLAPGSGARLTVKVKRFTNEPTLTFPWDRGWRN